MPGSASACTLYRAAEHHHLAGGIARNSQIFMLFGWLWLIPLILGYTHGPIGYSAARYGSGAAIIDACRAKSAPLAQRLLWFAALWLGGVGTVGIVAYGLRLWIAAK